jgi:hypothetical protein
MIDCLEMFPSVFNSRVEHEHGGSDWLLLGIETPFVFIIIEVFRSDTDGLWVSRGVVSFYFVE